MTYEEMIEKAKVAINSSSESSSVYIGADSIRYKKAGRWVAKYCTAIIIHKDSKHGGKIYYHTEVIPEYDIPSGLLKDEKDKRLRANLKTRLMNEAGFAIRAACDVLDEVNGRHLEIHLDLNNDPKHASNIAVKEACSYVLGATGIKATIKPEAFGATHAADHLVRK